MKEKIPSGYKKGSMQQFTPEQMQLFQQQFGHVGPNSYLSRLAGGDQSLFGEIEAPALKQFNQLQGQIGSKFSGMGTGGQKSSGFQNTMNAAAQDFAGQLQSQRQLLQQGALKDLMNFSNQILGQSPYENYLIKKQQKSNGWAGAAGAALGGLGGFFLGGPAGAMTGASLGHSVGSGFGGGGGGGGAQNYGFDPNFDVQDWAIANMPGGFH
jgi:hypothetical protein